MRKILHIGVSSERGGIEAFIMNVCSNFNEEDCKFTLIAECGAPANIESEVKNAGGEIIYVSSVSNKKQYIKDLWRVIEKNKYDVIHIHKNSLANPVSLLICKLKGCKNVILHSHNTQPTNASANITVHRICRFVFGLCNIKRIACSEKAAEWMFGKKYRNKNVVILKNGIDVEKYRFDNEERCRVRKELKIEDKLVIGSVGRLSEQKNPVFIVRIFEKMREKLPDLSLIMVGNGELKEELEKYISNSEFKGDINLLGVRKDIPSLLQGMDLFLMPSLHEGLPIAAVEAQAAGLPLLISEDVDKDVKILGSLEFDSIENDEEIWAEHALNMLKNSTRDNTCETIRHAGYDITQTVEQLKMIYAGQQ